MTALILTVALAAVIGISLGLLGGGGSILAVPLLVYLAGLPAKEAIATSLLVVGTTSAMAVLPHARAGRVRWRTGLIFGLAGMTGAYAGGRLAAHIPAGILLTAFAVMMLATAAAMIRGRRTLPPTPAPHELPVQRVIADGIVIGLITGLVGAGGGFLVVPALALLGGLPMPIAVGTSLVVIAMKSFAGLAGYLSTVHINWPLAAALTAAAVLGSLAGGRLTGRIQENALRKAFGWFVVAMGILILAQQLPANLRSDPRTLAAAGVIAAATAAAATLHRRRKRPSLRSATPNRSRGNGRHGDEQREDDPRATAGPVHEESNAVEKRGTWATAAVLPPRRPSRQPRPQTTDPTSVPARHGPARDTKRGAASGPGCRTHSDQLRRGR